MEKLLELSFKTTNECSYYFAKELLLDSNILVAFTTRIGGVSKHPFKGLNLGLHVGDDPEKVIANRRIISKALNIDLNRLTCAEQVHGSAVAIIDETGVGQGAFSFNDSIHGVDALVATDQNIPLALFYADCVPVVMVDPHRKVVAVAHAGWRGIYNRIIENTIQAMVDTGGANIENMIAFIGPAIGSCCYEIGEDLLKRFRERLINESMWLKTGSRIDLKELVKMQLDESGVKNNRTSIHSFCTACNNDVLFSHRADNGSTGRHAAISNIFADKDMQRIL